jgi:hypothetical protein
MARACVLGIQRMPLPAVPAARAAAHTPLTAVAGPPRIESAVPEVSRFFGIVIKVFYNDHAPPHFHAEYGEHEALVEIETLAIYRGSLPRRALALVLEWAALHRDDLRRDWDLAGSGQRPAPIEPLE